MFHKISSNGVGFMKKIALVTGGTEGIGLAICKKLLRNNITVIGTYSNNEENANKAKEQLGKISSDFYLKKSSNNNEKDIKELAKYIRKEYGYLNYLVNNAGISKSEISLRMSNEEWSNVIDVNLSGTFYTTREMAPLLFKSEKSSIVNISSQVGKFGNVGQVNYAASKSGIFGLTHTFAQEFSKKRVRVNAVSPGFVDTSILAEMSGELLEKRKSRILLNRLAKPSEIANVVYFLLSDESSYINSTILDVDGGVAF